MSLLTKDLIEKCKKYPLYSQDGKGGDATVIARFYIPKEFCRDGAFNWIITEGNVFYTDGKPTDIVMFGYACLNGDIQNSELGYIMLSELEEINNNHNLPLVRRDMKYDKNINFRKHFIMYLSSCKNLLSMRFINLNILKKIVFFDLLLLDI